MAGGGDGFVCVPEGTGDGLLFRIIDFAAFRPSHEHGEQTADNGEAGGAPEEGFDGANSRSAQNDVLAGVHGMKAHEELDGGGSQHDEHKDEDLRLLGKFF
jgi:hypothetical protein